MFLKEHTEQDVGKHIMFCVTVCMWGGGEQDVAVLERSSMYSKKFMFSMCILPFLPSLPPSPNNVDVHLRLIHLALWERGARSILPNVPTVLFKSVGKDPSCPSFC